MTNSVDSLNGLEGLLAVLGQVLVVLEDQALEEQLLEGQVSARSAGGGAGGSAIL